MNLDFQNIEEKYNKLLDWIYSFTNLEIVRDEKNYNENYKLKKISYILNKIGNPHENKFIIHITGTKGKGSVAYILSSILINNGFKVGLYTSPHIFDVTERIKINNQNINKSDFVKYANEIKNIVDKIDRIKEKEYIPTFFDILTAIAFVYFAENNCDIWIIEVGIGGKHDSTNIVNSSVSIITSISKDHTKILGNTLEKIAYQKAGIIKEGKPLVLGNVRKNIFKLINEEANKKNSKLFYSNDYYNFKVKRLFINNNKLLQEMVYDKIVFYSYLLGEFQSNNFSIAFTAIDLLNNYYNFKIKIDYEIFKNLIWPGRLNFFKTIYKNKEINIIIDGAHNEESAKYFTKSINLLYKNKIITGINNLLVIGMMADKDHKNILKEVIFNANNIFFVEPDKYKDCLIENYESIYLKIKPESQKYLKIKSDFNYLKDDICLQIDLNNNIEKIKMNPEKVKLINSFLKLYEDHYNSIPDNVFFVGSLYLTSIALKDLKELNK